MENLLLVGLDLSFHFVAVLQGEPGFTGIEGPQGRMGSKGPMGPPGATGRAGRDGRKVKRKKLILTNELKLNRVVHLCMQGSKGAAGSRGTKGATVRQSELSRYTK